MSRVLVTGASGFIGCACASLLVANGHEVHAVTSKRTGSGPAGVTLHTCDLLQPDDVAQLVKAARATHLLHLAWRPAHGDVWNALDNERWVGASVRLLHAFRDAGGERVVGTGSCAEYEWQQGLCVEDLTPLCPSTYYGFCKGAVREMFLGAALATELSVAWARVFFVYGPGEHPSRLVSNVITGLLKGEKVACSHGLQIRDYLHVADVAAGLVALVESDAEGAFNLCSGEATRVLDILQALARLLGRPELLDIGARPSAAHEPPLILGSCEKTRSTLGFQPGRSLTQGLEDTCRWWREQVPERTYTSRP